MGLRRCKRSRGGPGEPIELRTRLVSLICRDFGEGLFSLPLAHKCRYSSKNCEDCFRPRLEFSHPNPSRSRASAPSRAFRHSSTKTNLFFSTLGPPATSGATSSWMSELTGYAEVRPLRCPRPTPATRYVYTPQNLLANPSTQHYTLQKFLVSRRCVQTCTFLFAYLVRCSFYRIPTGEDLAASDGCQSETVTSGNPTGFCPNIRHYISEAS